MSFYIDIFIELLIGFFALLLLTRLLGKTTINQISTFDFIAVLILGELLGAAMYVKGVELFHIIFAMLVWGSLIFLSAYITQKFRKTRKYLEGYPSIVIKNGIVDFKVMKKNKLDLNQLAMLLRSKEIFSFNDVAFAIIETNGDISVMKKHLCSNVTNNDLQLAPQKVTLPYLLIMDGEVIHENLKEINKDASWLNNLLLGASFKSSSDVFIAQWDETSGLFIQGY